jgi:hypothetical protein
VRILAALVFVAFGLAAAGGNLYVLFGGAESEVPWRRVFQMCGAGVGLLFSLAFALGGVGLFRAPGRLRIFSAGSGVAGFAVFVASLVAAAVVTGSLRWAFLGGGLLVGGAAVVALRHTMFRHASWNRLPGPPGDGGSHER